MNAEDGKTVPYTHRATITICSNGPAAEVNITVTFDPDQEGKDLKELGYLPACFELVQEYMLPAIEAAYMDWSADPLLRMESPSGYDN
jgi:hypothetical protein